MGAVANEYASGDAAVRAVQAGADMILMPADFSAAYAGVRNAVQNGTITEERINDSGSKKQNKHSGINIRLTQNSRAVMCL